MLLFLFLIFMKFFIISGGFTINWSEEKPHNNFISIGGASNLFFCTPHDSENCTRVIHFKISSNNSFMCQEKHISILMNILEPIFEIVKLEPSTSSHPCSCKIEQKRLWVMGYLSLNTGRYTAQQEYESKCKRLKRYYLNDFETIVVIDQKLDLVQNDIIDKFIADHFFNVLSLYTFVLFKFKYYDEENDSLLEWKLAEHLLVAISVVYMFYKLKRNLISFYNRIFNDFNIDGSLRAELMEIKKQLDKNKKLFSKPEIENQEIINSESLNSEIESRVKKLTRIKKK